MMAKDFLIEFDHEMRQTRKLLERVPEDGLTFRPHPRSKTLGALALHVAGIPSWTTNLLGEDSYDLASRHGSEAMRAQSRGDARRSARGSSMRNVARARAHIEEQERGEAGDEVVAHNAAPRPWSRCRAGRCCGNS